MEHIDSMPSHIGSVTSEEIQDIVERSPKIISSSVIGFLAFFVGLLIAVSFLVSYPDVLIGQATLNATQSSVKLVMPTHGKLVLSDINPQQLVEEGDVLAVIQNPATTEHVLALKALLQENDDPISQRSTVFPNGLNVGELRLHYSTYLNLLKTHEHESANDIYAQQIRYSRAALADLRAVMQQDMKINFTQQRRYAIARKSYQRDSALFAQGVVAELQFEKSEEALLSYKNTLQNSEAKILSHAQSILSLEERIRELEIKRKDRSVELTAKISEAYNDLVAQIASWEQTYTIRSPITGQIEYLQFWVDNQYVTSGTALFSVIPSGNLNRLEVSIPSTGVGKVEIGQETIIKLDDFPYQEYGVLIGKVSSISMTKVPSDSTSITLIGVQLTDENVTNFGHLLDLKYGMRATVEIVTQDKKLIHRIFERLNVNRI